MKLNLSKPGLFITATDTDAGKTVVTCAIAANLRSKGYTVGVCKPYATGCRREREGLISPDAEALAYFADCRLPLDVVNPVRYHAPLAPAVAAESEQPEGNEEDIAESLSRLDRISDVLLIEGIGGLLTPISENQTVLDLMRQIGYPAMVVTRAVLGTLNHTAMTCRLIRNAGLSLAGLVVNRYHADTTDLAEATNPRWLAKQNETTILATVPDAPGVALDKARLPEEILVAVGMVDWMNIAKRPCFIK